MSARLATITALVGLGLGLTLASTPAPASAAPSTVAAPPADPTADDPSGFESASGIESEGSFELEAHVDGLYPGAEVTMEVAVVNDQAVTIEVSSLAVAVRDTSVHCPSGLLVLEPSSVPVTVAPGATGAVPVRVILDEAAPDVCQGATFALDLQASAVEVAGPSGAGAPPASAAPSSGRLPRTGASIAVLTALGLAAVLLGLGLHRRTRRSSPC